MMFMPWYTLTLHDFVVVRPLVIAILLLFQLQFNFFVKRPLNYTDTAQICYNYSSISGTGKAKMTVQRGLEQIRTLKNEGMHPKLVIHLASSFGQKVE